MLGRNMSMWCMHSAVNTITGDELSEFHGLQDGMDTVRDKCGP